MKIYKVIMAMGMLGALVITPAAVAHAKSADQVGANVTTVEAPRGAVASIQSSWTSPTLQPGASWHYRWNNAPTGLVFAVDLSPVGASTTTPCKYEVVRQWDQRNSDGEREFWVLFRNVGSIACATQVLLTYQETLQYNWNTGSLAPGGSMTTHWNNTPLNATYIVGVSPYGATTTSPCKLQVTRQWYRRLLANSVWEREFYFTVKNIGSITCGGFIRIGFDTAASDDNFSRTLDPGATEYWYWNNNPPAAVLTVGLRPFGDECVYELLGFTHVQQYKSDGTFQQRLLIGYKNISSHRCTVQVHIAAMAA